MSDTLPSRLVQLARALASDPVDGVARFKTVRRQFTGLPVSGVGFEVAEQAIEDLGGQTDISTLSAVAIERWKKEPRSVARVGYEAVLGAVWDTLAQKELRGDALDSRERDTQTKLRDVFYPPRSGEAI